MDIHDIIILVLFHHIFHDNLLLSIVRDKMILRQSPHEAREERTLAKDWKRLHCKDRQARSPLKTDMNWKVADISEVISTRLPTDSVAEVLMLLVTGDKHTESIGVEEVERANRAPG